MIAMIILRLSTYSLERGINMTNWWFAGSRAKYVKNHVYAKEVIRQFILVNLVAGDTVQTGGEPSGVDGWVEDIIFKSFPLIIQRPSLNANWKNGRQAGILRNIEGIDNNDKVAVFYDGFSKGSDHVIKYAKKQNKLAKVYLI